ncbi:peptidyl-tRNA hydrolase [Candidatus Micrarchaeota archaeon]|nr:peptidyl-tRNA hydrolase [Candidatus Micrarchaeota archaeon]
MYKQIIVVRADIGMGKGKLAAQSSHASLGAYNKTLKTKPETVRGWEQQGQTKVVLKVNSESELVEFFELAKRAKIPCELIRDAGRTQLEPGTLTAMAAGPWDEQELDKIFGKLKLL